jgi:hypothetical protein
MLNREQAVKKFENQIKNKLGPMYGELMRLSATDPKRVEQIFTQLWADFVEQQILKKNTTLSEVRTWKKPF